MPKERFTVIPAVYLLLEKDEHILLLRRKNTSFGEGLFSFPAGHVDGGESLLQAMTREAREEIDVHIEEDDLSLCHVMHRNCGDHERVDFFFKTTVWEREVMNAEPEKCSELLWVHHKTLHDDLMEYLKQAVQCIYVGQVYSQDKWH